MTVKKLKILVGSCHTNLSKDLMIHHVCQHYCTKGDKKMRISAEIISSVDDNLDFLQKISIGNETWCFLYNLHSNYMKCKSQVHH